MQLFMKLKLIVISLLFISYSQAQNIINYIPVADNRGLKDSKYLDELLSKQDYIKILDLIAGEPDESFKIDWLAKKSGEGHTILMFELSRFLNSKGDFEKVLKWYYAGLARFIQDTECYENQVFEDYLNNLAEKYATCEETSYITEEQKRFASLNIDNIFKNSIEIVENIKKYPSPKWVLDNCIDQENGLTVKLKPENCWKDSWKAGLDKFKLNFVANK